MCFLTSGTFCLLVSLWFHNRKSYNFQIHLTLQSYATHIFTEHLCSHNMGWRYKEKQRLGHLHQIIIIQCDRYSDGIRCKVMWEHWEDLNSGREDWRRRHRSVIGIAAASNQVFLTLVPWAALSFAFFLSANSFLHFGTFCWHCVLQEVSLNPLFLPA